MSSYMQRESEGKTPLELPLTTEADELQEKVRRAKEELDELRRKQEQIEKEKQRLEELTRRQEALENGKTEMVEKLTQALSLIARQTEELEQRAEQLRVVHKNFSSFLTNLQSLHPKQWTATEAAKELSRGQAILDEARSEYQRALARFSIEEPELHEATVQESSEEQDVRDFAYWLRVGFAFTLPMQVIGWIGIIVWIWWFLSQSR